jgi:hypothetical protein
MMMRAAARLSAAEASASVSYSSHNRFAPSTARKISQRVPSRLTATHGSSSSGSRPGGGFAARGMATSSADPSGQASAATAATAATATTTAAGGGSGGGPGGSGGSSSSWLSVAVLFAPSAVCEFLCKWQVDRYQWKRGELAAREAALTTPDLTAADLAAMAKRGGAVQVEDPVLYRPVARKRLVSNP